MVILAEILRGREPCRSINSVVIGICVVYRAVDQFLLDVRGDASGGAQLHNVEFPTVGPDDGTGIIAHHPKGRPQTIGSIRDFDPGFYFTVFECESSLGEHTCGRERISPIIRAVSLNHKISVRSVSIPVLGGVIFQLAIAPTLIANIISPRA